MPQWLRLRAGQPAYDESYWKFLPRFFDVHLSAADFPFVLQGEHFETGHLWFVVLLLTFSLLPAPDLPAPDLPAGAGRRARCFAYLGAAALPIYVLHQPIVVAVAYGVVRWNTPIVVEWAVIVAVSLVLIFAVYDLLVRRTRVTRVLFGMRA